MKTFYASLVTTMFFVDLVVSLCELGGALPLKGQVSSVAVGAGIDAAMSLFGVFSLMYGDE